MKSRGLVILATGSRDWTDRFKIESVLSAYNGDLYVSPIRLLHGDSGWADQIAAETARRLGWTVIGEPYFDDLGTDGGPVRNQLLVNIAQVYRRFHYDVIVEAFHMSNSRGTANCIAQARGANLSINIHLPSEGA